MILHMLIGFIRERSVFECRARPACARRRWRESRELTVAVLYVSPMASSRERTPIYRMCISIASTLCTDSFWDLTAAAVLHVGPSRNWCNVVCAE